MIKKVFLSINSKYAQSNPHFFTIIRRASTNVRPFRSIPGPKFIHRAFLPGGECFKKDSTTFLNYLHRRYGNIFKLFQLTRESFMVITFDPEDFKKVYRAEGLWPIRKFVPSSDFYRLKLAPESAGMLNLHDQEWYRIRSVLNPIMMHPKIIQSYIPKIDDVTKDFIAITKTLLDSNNETPANFEEYIKRWALESAALMAFDLRVGALDDTKNKLGAQLVEAVNDVIELYYELDILPSVWRYISTPKFRKLMMRQEEIRSLKVINFISIAVHFLNESKCQRLRKITNENDKSVLEKIIEIDESLAQPVAIDILSGGIDTVTSICKSILYLLAKNTKKQDKLREEVLKALPYKDTVLTTDKIRNLPFLRAVIKESFRIYPPTLGNARELKDDITLQGYNIPKGTQIAFPNAALCQNEKYFPRSKEFIPERWLRDGSHLQEECPNAREAHPFVYLPFGFGPRSCVGQRFAELEIMIFVMRFIREFNLEWHHKDLKVRSTLIENLVGDAKFKLNVT